MNDLESFTAQKIRSSLLSRAGYIVFLLVVALNIAFRTLTEVGVCLQSLVRLTTDCVLYLTSVYVTFCAMAETARHDAKSREAYLSALAACEREIAEAKPLRAHLCRYCIDYINSEREEQRREILEPHGISIKAYLSELTGKSRRELAAVGLDRVQIRAIRAADRIRPLKLDRASLFSARVKSGRRSLMESPAKMQARRYTTSLLPTTVFAVFSAQIVFAVQANGDIRTVLVESLLRVALLTWTAVRGYAVGERTVLSDTVEYLLAKTDFLHGFRLFALKQNEVPSSGIR